MTVCSEQPDEEAAQKMHRRFTSEDLGQRAEREELTAQMMAHMPGAIQIG